MPASGDAYSGCSFAATAGSPEAPSAQMALIRTSPMSLADQPVNFEIQSSLAGFASSSSAALSAAMASGAIGGSRRPIARARYRRIRGSSSLARSKAVTSGWLSERSARTFGSSINLDNS